LSSFFLSPDIFVFYLDCLFFLFIFLDDAGSLGQAKPLKFAGRVKLLAINAALRPMPVSQEFFLDLDVN